MNVHGPQSTYAPTRYMQGRIVEKLGACKEKMCTYFPTVTSPLELNAAF
jgi:hypothetical protein